MLSRIVVVCALISVLSRPAAAIDKLGEDRKKTPEITKCLPPDLAVCERDKRPCCCMFWTPWINADQNLTDGGDFESMGYSLTVEEGEHGRVTRWLANNGIVCNTPARVECRNACTKKPWWTTGDDTVWQKRINCDTDDGFICPDSEQADGHCHDYEVRLLCWKECDQLKWGEWFDKDDPGGYGDFERPGWHDHPARHAPPCPDGGTPFEVDCRTLTGTHAAIAPDPKVLCSVNDGFTCNEGQQPDGSCEDYHVRYLCGIP